MFEFFAIILIASLPGAAYGLLNITVDDTNTTAILYTGNWQQALPSRFDFGGTHRLSDSASATANFTFRGVGVYFMSPLWPYLVTTQISLDSGPPVVLDLVDHGPNNGGSEETVQSQAVWGVSGLMDTTHTVVVSKPPRDPYAVLDGFIYTVLDPSASTSSTYSSSASSTSLLVGTTSSAASTTTPPNHTLAIALGSVFGVVGIALVVAAFFFCRRRRTRSTPESAPWTLGGADHPALTGRSSTQMATAPFSAATSFSAFSGQPYPKSNQPYAAVAQGFDSTHSLHSQNVHHAPPSMVGAAPSSIRHAEANQSIYLNGGQQPVHDHWQAGTARTNDSITGRGPYQANTLSTTTETSLGPYPNPWSEFGHQGPSEGSDRMISAASTASYVPSQHQKERELLSYRSPEFSPDQPPAYNAAPLP